MRQANSWDKNTCGAPFGCGAGGGVHEWVSFTLEKSKIQRWKIIFGFNIKLFGEPKISTPASS